MADRIELEVRRAAARLIPGGSTVLVAASGGGDSTALLHLLARMARGGRWSLVAAHLDHGLRRGSRADRRFVEQLARSLSIDCVADRREVAASRRRGESPEEAARRVRREFLLEAAGTVDAELIATGHTLDDQAETILMRLVRGAGTTGLAGMAESGPGPFVRPLLTLERRELRDWLARRGLRYREDPSNRDLRFDRNRVRRLVLPLLAEQLNPRAARNLVAAARRIRDDATYLDELAAGVADRALRSVGGSRLDVRLAILGRTPPVLARRVARIAIARAGADPRRVLSRHVEALVGLADAPGGSRIHLPGGLTARKTGEMIVIAPG